MAGLTFCEHRGCKIEMYHFHIVVGILSMSCVILLDCILFMVDEMDLNGL